MIRYIKALVAAWRLVHLNADIKGDLNAVNIDLERVHPVVTVELSLESAQPGLQSLFWADRKGHAVVDVSINQLSGVAKLKVEKNLGLGLETIETPWLSGWLGEKPEDFGFDKYRNVIMPNGTTAWETARSSDHWVIHIHGRKAARAEALRNIRQFDELRFKQLFISHESDRAPDGLGKARSDLGATEWKQVESVVNYAANQGAKHIILFGWSLGAMFAGQFVLKSEFKHLVSALIFDSPLIDYESTLRLQAQLAGFDKDFGSYVFRLLQNSKLLWLLGIRQRLIPSLIERLEKPTLFLYSKSDGFVAMDKVGDFVALNPLSTVVEFDDARHCRLFNKDSKRYQAAIARFVSSIEL